MYDSTFTAGLLNPYPMNPVSHEPADLRTLRLHVHVMNVTSEACQTSCQRSCSMI